MRHVLTGVGLGQPTVQAAKLRKKNDGDGRIRGCTAALAACATQTLTTVLQIRASSTPKKKNKIIGRSRGCTAALEACMDIRASRHVGSTS